MCLNMGFTEIYDAQKGFKVYRCICIFMRRTYNFIRQDVKIELCNDKFKVHLCFDDEVHIKHGDVL